MVHIFMMFIKNKAVIINVITRVLVGLIGGFVLTNLVAILISNMSNDIDGIVAGMMLSFIVYTAIVMFVFSTKTALRAMLYVVFACVVAFGVISYIDMVAK